MRKLEGWNTITMTQEFGVSIGPTQLPSGTMHG